MSPWLPMNVALFLVALVAIYFLRHDRRAHDREVAAKRARLYKGALECSDG